MTREMLENLVGYGTGIMLILALSTILVFVLLYRRKWKKLNPNKYPKYETRTTLFIKNIFEELKEAGHANQYLKNEYLSLKELENLGLEGNHPLYLRQKNQWHKAEQLTHFITEEKRTKEEIQNFATYLMYEEMSSLNPNYLGHSYEKETNYLSLFQVKLNNLKQKFITNTF